MSTSHDTPDPYAALREQALLDIDTWKPEQPDELLEGEVLMVERVTFGEGSRQSVKPIATVRQPDGTEVRTPASTVLERQFDELGLQSGDLVVIRFIGEVEGRNGTYKSFRTVAARNGEQVAANASPRAGSVDDGSDGLLPGPPPFDPSEEPF